MLAADAGAVAIFESCVLERAMRDVKDFLAAALRTAHTIGPALGYQIALTGFFIGKLFEMYF